MTRSILAAIAGQDAPLAPGCNSRGRLPLDLDSHECRFPLHGAGADTRFCAVEIAPGEWMPGRDGGSYCRYHRLLATGRGTEGERTAHRALERRGAR
jgi:hypothetical protein